MRFLKEWAFAKRVDPYNLQFPVRGCTRMRYATLHLILCLTVCSTTQTRVWAEDAPAANSRPPHIFVDVGACPFECCTYRQWTADEAITLWDQPNGTRVVGSLSKGQIVQGLSGEVRSTPLPVISDRDIPETDIKTDDTFYVLHYDGEGYWKVWFRGKLTLVNESVVNIPDPKAEWWVKINDLKGEIGWTISHGNFEHQDACE